MSKKIKTLSISWKNKPEEALLTKQLAAIYKSYKAKITSGIITPDDVCISISRLAYNLLLVHQTILPQKEPINKFMGINIEIEELQEYYIALKSINQNYHNQTETNKRILQQVKKQ